MTITSRAEGEAATISVTDPAAVNSPQMIDVTLTVRAPEIVLSSNSLGFAAANGEPVASTIVQAVAECLAGMVYVNALQPGHPAVFGTWPFVSDLRTGAMSGGSGEQALLTAGCAQMHRFYGLPGGAAAGNGTSGIRRPSPCCRRRRARTTLTSS